MILYTKLRFYFLTSRSHYSFLFGNRNYESGPKGKKTYDSCSGNDFAAPCIRSYWICLQQQQLFSPSIVPFKTDIGGGTRERSNDKIGIQSVVEGATDYRSPPQLWPGRRPGRNMLQNSSKCSQLHQKLSYLLTVQCMVTVSIQRVNS